MLISREGQEENTGIDYAEWAARMKVSFNLRIKDYTDVLR